MSPKITERAIRAMPYELRLKHYEKEKNELFFKLTHLSPREVQEKHQEIIKKWRI